MLLLSPKTVPFCSAAGSVWVQRGLALWGLTLHSVPCNLRRFCIGPRTDQCVSYINAILNFENNFPPTLVNLQYRSSNWLTADFSAMICWSVHANDMRLFSEIGWLYHIFLGFTHYHFFPVVYRTVSAKSPISAHRMLSLTDRALSQLHLSLLYKSLFRITCESLFSSVVF